MKEFTRTNQGYFHTGYFGRNDYFAPLPKWKKFLSSFFCQYGTRGGYLDISWYMSFILDEIPVYFFTDCGSDIELINITGTIIADAITMKYKTNAQTALADYNEWRGTAHKSWDTVFDQYIAVYRYHHVNATPNRWTMSGKSIEEWYAEIPK